MILGYATWSNCCFTDVMEELYEYIDDTCESLRVVISSGEERRWGIEMGGGLSRRGGTRGAVLARGLSFWEAAGWD